MHRNPLSSPSILFLFFYFLSSCVAVRRLESKSLNPCIEGSDFSASLFNVVFTPDNQTLHLNIVGVSEISGNVTVDLEVFAYGHRVLEQNLDPCTSKDLLGLCPMNRGQIKIDSIVTLDESMIKKVPGIAYTVPDLDGVVRIRINDTSSQQPLACVEAELSNGKTVYHKGVSWVAAVIAGLGLVASAVTSGLGHSNTAAHVAANAMSLFGFFQSQAILGMTSVELPPIVAAWTQNFQWSMGIIKVPALQRFCTWYQRATGGEPSKVLSSLQTTSVQVQKRSLESLPLMARAISSLVKRTNNYSEKNVESNTMITVHGIDRVGFRAKIELSNIFMTGYSIFIIFVVLIVLGVLAFKGACELLAKRGLLKGDQLRNFRNGWTTILKGILFRIVLIGYTQMCVLCFWELTQRDSAAQVVLAVFTIIAMIAILGWASSKVVRIARHSIQMHQNPAYILYSDPVSLNKWGFLYVQFKASSYYFVIPILIYILIKGMFIGLAQGKAVVQAVALVLLEASLLVAVSVMRPYMDKKTNAFNISIVAVNFISSIFLLFFTEVFNQPGLVTGVMGWVFFLVNAIFALTLLLMVLIASIYALVSKNPDARYQPMRDDRGSFIKSQTQLTTELEALGATARGDGPTSYKGRQIDDDSESFSSNSLAHQKEGRQHSNYSGNMTGTTGYSAHGQPRSPMDPAVPLFPSDGATGGRHGPPPPSFQTGDDHQYGRLENPRSDGFRQQNNSSPWQRGAGYE